MKTNEKISTEWQPGDDAAAARIMQTRFEIKVSKWACRLWRLGKLKDGSKLSKFYAAAYLEAALNREKQHEQPTRKP